MQEISKQLERILRETAEAAHEEELRRALGPLAEAFDRSGSRKIGSGELTDLIHKFDQGPARELFGKYESKICSALPSPTPSCLASSSARLFRSSCCSTQIARLLSTRNKIPGVELPHMRMQQPGSKLSSGNAMGKTAQAFVERGRQDTGQGCVARRWSKAQEITRSDVIFLLDRIVERGAPIAANRALAVVRRMFNFALSRA